ncbi:autotransporter outer membrane beta-barrel domain-containing protein [Actinobacillus equuli subsp. haemolyticus]|uniref:autotransporter outer membrane beta-barrel domain-containing protein n=1 Tax=Actinobacillus equuli TaxID=718 RepID=UPI002446750F|nr:autotransporter outer membrane beta-barrel domain-containing protein [Actinobacillus equuli]WGE50173.1 autotransporter outer membrane beta-barrel domain-containing protein [Actinobacillus equuli subsp. haemolyticus]
MKRLKLSAVYSALFAGGLFVYTDSAIAMECKAELDSITGQSNAVLNQCKMDLSGYTPIVTNSTLTISDSTLGRSVSRASEFDSPTFSTILYTDNSTVNVNNSTLSVTASNDYGQHVIQARNKSVINISNSDLLTQAEVGGTVSLDSSSGSITNSNLTTLGGDSAVLVEKSSLTIEGSKLTAGSEADAISFSGTNNTVTVNNSTMSSGTMLGSWWNGRAGTEYGSLKLTLNNTTVTSDVLAWGADSEDDFGLTAIENIDLQVADSTLSGAMVIPNNNTTYNVTLANSNWDVPVVAIDGTTYESSVSNLSLTNSTINLGKTEGFQTFTIGNLSGTGSFTLNSDLANQQADKIVVTGDDSGEFGLNVKDSGNEPKSANGKVTLVETQTGKAKFALLGRDYVDAGAYRYRLVKDGNHWLLSNNAAERATASNSTPPVANNSTNSTASPTVPVSPIVVPALNPTTANREVMLSEYSNALVSLRQAQLLLVENSLEGLHKRLGELKQGEKGNVWVRNANSRNELDAMQVAENARSSGFKQDIHMLQIGADAAVTDNIRIGGFVGNSRSDLEFDGEYGSAKVNAQAVGAYATYLANNGFYWDNVAKYERITAKSNQTGKRHYNAHTLSSEIGRIHTLGRWTITPQLQAAWTKLSSKVDEEGISALTARAGVRVANHLDFAGWKFEPYVELNGITTRTNQNAVRVNQYSFDVAETKGRIESAIGANAVVGNHRIGLEASLTNGKYLDQPYKVQLAYRYHW